MLIAKLAYRNLGRNARRSLITGLALALSAALSIAYYGLVDGMNAGLVHSLTRFDLGHVQAHAPGYSVRGVLDLTLPEGDAALASIRNEPKVVSASGRLYAPALAGAGAHSTGVQLIGVEPRSERRVTELHNQLSAGQYLDDEPTPWPKARELSAEESAQDAQLTESESDKAAAEIEELPELGSERPAKPGDAAGAPPATGEPAALLRNALSPRPSRPPNVILGASLARVLGVNVGDELFLSAQAKDGSAEGIRARVAGIFRTGTTGYDRVRVYLHVADLGRLVHLEGRFHEIAALATSPDDAPLVAARLRETLAPRGAEVRAWSELRPDILRMLDLNRAGGVLLAVIVFIVASLGVVNTMLMAVLERTRELGVLKAIGMSSGRLFAMIVTETAFLAVLGASAGTLLGLGLDLYLVRYGVDLGFITQGVSFAGVGMQPVVYGAVTPGGVLWPVAILSLVCVLASVYPALRAARMQPAVGMRET